jgi:hypothetical protein
METMSITTDVFRCGEFGIHSVAENARWLRGLLQNVFPAGDFVPTLFVSDCDNGSFQVSRYRKIHDLTNDVSSWAKLVNTRISGQDEALFNDLLSAKLVMGWGLTPAVIELLDRNNVDFVDVEVDPIRFGHDLFLRARTNCPNLREYFSSLHVDEAYFFSSAAEVRAFVYRRDPPAAHEGCSYGLFAGQCAIDLSLVRNGSITKPEEFISEIRKVADGVDILLVKPHPYDTNPRHLDILLDAVPNARITCSHIYRILADVNLKEVVSLSSSVLDEAALFGVKTMRLVSPDRDVSDLIPSSLSPWYRVGAECMDSNLAFAFTGRGHRPNYAQRKFNLRRSLNTDWGVAKLYSSPRLQLNIEGRRRSWPRFTRRGIGTAPRKYIS